MTAIVASVVLLFLALLVYGRHLRTAPWRLLALRTGVLILLALILIGEVYAIKWRTRSRRVAVLLDASESMRLAGADSTSQRLAAALNVPQGYRRDVWRFADSVMPPNHEPTVDEGRTRLLRAMARVLDSRPDAIVVLSDGQDNDEAPPAVAAPSVPVYAVGFGAAERTNLAISNVSAPAAVAVGESLDVVVRVLATGMQPGRVRVHARSELRELVLPAGTSEQTVTFRVAFGRAGLQTISVAVESLPGESSNEDNTGSVVVDVRPARYQILYVNGRPGAGSRFALATLRGNDRLDVRVVTPFGSPTGQPDVSRADAFILDEPSESGAMLSFYAAILQRVRAGANALVVAGPDVQTGPSLNELLGGTLAPARPGPFVPELTQDGRATTLFGGETDLSAVPPFIGVRVLTSGAQPAETWLRARGTGLSLMEVRSCGRGRVVYCAGYPIWRWGFGPSQQRAMLLGPFLDRLAGYLSTSAAEQFSLAPSRPAYLRGEPVVLRFRASGPTGLPWDDLEVRLLIHSADSAGSADSTAVSLMMVAGGAGTYGARVDGIAPGTYTATALATSNGNVAGRADTRFAAQDLSLERSRLGLNRALLVNLVGQTGGIYWPYESLPPGGIVIRPGVQTRRLSFDPRRTVPLYVIVALLAGAEWLLRRRKGLL